MAGEGAFSATAHPLNQLVLLNFWKVLNFPKAHIKKKFI
jgi:hypothetical protein